MTGNKKELTDRDKKLAERARIRAEREEKIARQKQEIEDMLDDQRFEIECKVDELGLKEHEYFIDESNDGLIAVKRAPVVVWKRFQKEISKPSKNKDLDKDLETVTRFIKDCLIYPSESDFDVLTNKEPLRMARLSDSAMKLCGSSDRSDEIKKS